MASLTNKIEIKTELRPCYYGTKKALFHKWVELSEIVSPSLMVGGHNGGVVSKNYALVETEDGFMHYAEIYDILFIDNKFNEYDFERFENE